MVLLKYSDNRLLLAAVTMGAFVAFMILAYLRPSMSAHDGSISLFGGGINGILMPLVILATVGLVVRLVAMSAGNLTAIETNERGLVVHGFWGEKAISWDELATVEIHWIRINFWKKTGQLVVKGTKSRSTIPLGWVGLSSESAKKVVKDIQEMRNRHSLASAAPAGEEAADQGDFDAEAALNRYLARKHGSAVSSPAATLPPTQVPGLGGARPVFGRKAQPR